MLPYFRILHQDSYSTYYCGGQVSKGSINVITGGGGYVHATICDKGIRGYVSAPTYPSEYNLNDV